ncbi:SusD/RagB family nutrient-binding outer membrane lipoprotein [Chitinophaga sp. LS1]|uniref:SusD/RagB family nutrient-binding outer membrane lipoprotein n=1 Tax=Chitinophaga sp. LS1 TaxID=3051176 RepID=UPI002AAB26BC|nr:SusD/RagB family nutrient-binding outer membrane lipoprotein [Chitinophaga sp. LS1]WPV67614.1 SusD/RagB family nutrient-binding outer membrane lipoprotein [Chitinophaga sp. LS1]
MKKYFLHISCIITLAIGMTGCKKQLEDYYTNPDKTTDPTIEKLFSSILDNNRIRPMYWDLRTLQLNQMGKYCQMTAFLNELTTYSQNDDYIEDRWNDFYTPNNQGSNANDAGSGSGPMAQYRTMQRLYKELPVDERPNMEVFMMAGRVLLLDQAAQMVDMFGDIPYSEAGSLDATATISNPKFDSQIAVYDTVLTQLKEMADWFAAATLNTVAASAFANQDYVGHGSLSKWRRYINSLRLRYLLRQSYYDEARAKTEIQEILSSPLQYPLMDGDGVGDTYSPYNTDMLLFQLTTYTNNLNSAFTEISAQAAPDYMLNTVMLPVDDPRIPLMFDKFGATVNSVFVPNATYKAMSQQWTSTMQGDSINNYSTIDSTTYRFNSHLPGVMMSAAETNFLKAEAFERWGLTGGTAAASYELAIRQSIAFQYYLHSTNTTQYESVTQPSTAEVDVFMAKTAIAYSGTSQEKLGKIWTQKWLAFGFTQCGQAWAEYRRTKYPQITIWQSTSSIYPTPPNRFTYPASEKAYNTSYADVQANDTRTAKIFWDVN